jgi:hypothetical protein
MSELQRCKGTNCGCTDGVSHSAECRAEHDALCYQAEIGDLRADLAQRTAERDEARRALCVSQAVDYLCETNPDEPISYGESRRIASEFAAEHGWDCFDAKEGER